MKDLRIGFLGAGNMASAMVGGLLRSGAVVAAQVRASDPQVQTRDAWAKNYGIAVTEKNEEVVDWANVIILAVKPQLLPAVLEQSASAFGPGHLVISIAAGASIASIEQRLPTGVRVIRAMPNTGALVSASATAIARGSRATAEDLDFAKFVFDSVGKTVVLEEGHLDAVTGLSGSGPGYVMLFIEALADGGVKVGLPRDVALLLAAQTVLGAAQLLVERGEHPARLKDMVTSPGGTTISGLLALETGAVRGAVITAVEQATRRAAELGKKVS